MGRKRLIAGNWKMFKTGSELPGFFDNFIRESRLEDLEHDSDVLFAVPSTMLHQAKQICSNSPIMISAQNCHYEPSGAFTGEISLPMLQDIGVRATLIGHSERRQFFGDTDEVVGRKVQSAQAAGFLSIVCIGESKADRESGDTFSVLSDQLDAFLPLVTNWDNLVVAYEPVWAIGTGLTASVEQAQEAHAFIRKQIALVNSNEAQKVRILYGGSVKPGNARGLLDQEDIDGALVGGASLNPTDFAGIIHA